MGGGVGAGVAAGVGEGVAVGVGAGVAVGVGAGVAVGGGEGVAVGVAAGVVVGVAVGVGAGVAVGVGVGVGEGVTVGVGVAVGVGEGVTVAGGGVPVDEGACAAVATIEGGSLSPSSPPLQASAEARAANSSARPNNARADRHRLRHRVEGCHLHRSSITDADRREIGCASASLPGGALIDSEGSGV